MHTGKAASCILPNVLIEAFVEAASANDRTSLVPLRFAGGVGVFCTYPGPSTNTAPRVRIRQKATTEHCDEQFHLDAHSTSVCRKQFVIMSVVLPLRRALSADSAFDVEVVVA